MTNELTDTRKNDIISIARTLVEAEKNKQDLSEFDSDIKFSIGHGALNAAIYLHELGFRLSALDDVSIVVKDGRVSEVYSNNENLAVNVMDFDGLEQDEYDALDREASKVRQTQHSVW